jgi:hypothetical protein
MTSNQKSLICSNIRQTRGERISEAELTLEERTSLWNRVLISFLIAGFSLFIWLFVFEQAQLPLTGWKPFIWVGLPFGIVLPISFFLSYEVFYPKRVRKSRMFHLKRFLRRTLSGQAVLLSIAGSTSYTDVSFSRVLGNQAWFLGFGLCLFVFAVAAVLWLRHKNFESPQ